MTERVESLVDDMCNLSDGVEQAMEALKIPVEKQESYLEQIRK